AASLAGAANTLVFLVSALALVALAWIVGVATEQLGENSGPKIGGVLNATFGNAAELIITIFAIRAGQLEVATASITGSILGNTLLVLGASFLVGGLKNGIQTFDQRIAGMNASMLALAVIGLGIPTAFAAARGTGSDTQTISDVTAAILLGLYLLSLVYYFRTGAGGGPPPGVDGGCGRDRGRLRGNAGGCDLRSRHQRGVPRARDRPDRREHRREHRRHQDRLREQDGLLDGRLARLVAPGGARRCAPARLHLAPDPAPLRPRVPGHPGDRPGGRRHHCSAHRRRRRVELARGGPAHG